MSPLPSRSTVYRVLVRHGLVPARKRKRRRQGYKRWQRQAPMQLWQLDVTGSVFLADGTECKLISGIDDHSRFCVIATVVRRATARAVCRAFVAAMRLYVIPDEVLTDIQTVWCPGKPCVVRPAVRGFAAPAAITVQRRVSSGGGILVARQKIQAGKTHPAKIVTVVCGKNSFRLVIDGDTVAEAPRITSREIGRYKACGTRPGRR